MHEEHAHNTVKADTRCIHFEANRRKAYIHINSMVTTLLEMLCMYHACYMHRTRGNMHVAVHMLETCSNSLIHACSMHVSCNMHVFGTFSMHVTCLQHACIQHACYIHVRYMHVKNMQATCKLHAHYIFV